MAFDDRHTEFLALAALIGITTAISLPVLRFLGCEGWCLGMGVIGCNVVAYGLILFAALHPDSFSDWFKWKVLRKTKPMIDFLTWIGTVEGLSLIEKPEGNRSVRYITISSDVSVSTLEQLLA